MADVCSANVGVRAAARGELECFAFRAAMHRLYHGSFVALLALGAVVVPWGNWHEPAAMTAVTGATYPLGRRSVVVLAAQ